MSRIMSALQCVVQIPSWCAIGLVRLYQLTLSPLIGRHCRFHPTCSRYSIEAFRKYGFIRGLFQTVVRISKCHPWHPGGVDLP